MKFSIIRFVIPIFRTFFEQNRASSGKIDGQGNWFSRRVFFEINSCAKKKKKKERRRKLSCGMEIRSRIYEAEHDPRQWWNIGCSVCRQGYGNKIIKGIEEGGIRESEREVYPVADRMRNGEKEKGNRRFSGSLLRNRVNSRSTGITWFKRYVRLSPIKFPVVDLDRPLLLPASIIKIGIMNSSFELIRV